jgi:hypothetical protein
MQTLTDAKAYVDAQVIAAGSITETQVQAIADAGDAQTLADANAYADAGDAQTLADAKVHAETYADTGNAQTLADANTYTDASTSRTLTDAKSYIDAQVISAGSITETQVQAIADAGDAQTLSDANAYADSGDVATLKSANTYTDQQVASYNQGLDQFRGEMDDRFHKVDRRIDRLGATSAAYAGLAANTAGLGGVNNIGIGIGSQGGEQALAIGYRRAIGNRASVSFGGAIAGGESSVSAGAGFSW